MTENKDKHSAKDKDQKSDVHLIKEQENDGSRQTPAAAKGHQTTTQQPTQSQPPPIAEVPSQSRPPHNPPPQPQPPADRCRKFSHFLDILNIPRHYTGSHSGSNSSNTSAQLSPLTPHAGTSAQGQMTTTTGVVHSGRGSKEGIDDVCDANSTMTTMVATENRQQLQQQDNRKQNQSSPLLLQDVQHRPSSSFYGTACLSFQSEILLLDMTSGEISDTTERSSHKEEFGTQRVYKKTSPNCVLTLYLPSREIILSGNSPSLFRGIVFVDAKSIQGYRVYAQLTLTFRYGREDEEVMGLRFCNEAIMSIHQIWPRSEEPAKESLSPLQEALLKRLGEGAFPFTLSLTAQAPPSVQLVPAKRYYGAPIGTSYDVRCFIADKTDEKFHRRASVKMGVRVIYRTDVFNHSISGPEHFAALVNNPASAVPPCSRPQSADSSGAALPHAPASHSATTASATTESNVTDSRTKSKKSERGDSFPKLRLSPKAFRFSSRFGRSKSEVEKCPNDPFHSYSKSFQEYDSAGGVSGVSIGSGGPQGAVDKPFLLQDGRVGLRASLDKAWYTHGEEVNVTINIRNDSRKTVRKVRVCAIQHVDVCMFNNGKFKNVVADSDNLSPAALDRTVPPGGTLNTTVSLKPQRGPTKNWIALEDTLQRSTEPEDITGVIAASAIRTPHFLMQSNHSPFYCTSPGACNQSMQPSTTVIPITSTTDERNVFAIYVSYYVKVKLTLSGIGGELSLKLPFLLVHIDEELAQLAEQQVKLALDDVPSNKKNGNKIKAPAGPIESSHEFTISHNLERIESVDERNIQQKHSSDNPRASTTAVAACEADDECQPSTSSGSSRRRQLTRSETIGKNVGDEHEEQAVVPATNEANLELLVHVAQVHANNLHRTTDAQPQEQQTDHLEMENKSLEPQGSHDPSITSHRPETSQR